MPYKQMLHSLFSGAHETADQQEADFNKQRDEDIAMYTKVLQAPPIESDPVHGVSEDQRNRAATQIGKLRNLKKGENPYLQLAGYLNNLGSGIRKARAQVTTPPPSTVPGPEGTTRPATLTPLTAQGPEGSGATRKRKLLGTLAQVGGGLVAAGGNLLTGGGPGTPLSELPPVDPKAFTHPGGGEILGKHFGSYRNEAGYKVDQFIGLDNVIRERVSDQKVERTGAVRKGVPLSVRQGRQLAAQGYKFTDGDGKPIDLSQLPDNMALMSFNRSDGTTFYSPFSPTDKVVSAMGQKYTISPYDLDVLAQAGTSIGPAIMPTTTLKETPAIAGGEPTTNVMSTERIPSAPGFPRQAAPAPTGATGATGATGMTPLNAPSGTPRGAGAGAGAAPTPPPATRPTANRPIHMTPGQFNQQMNIVRPVREAAVQLLGDPEHPGFQPLTAFAGIADNKVSRDKVAQAVKLTLNGIDTEVTNHGGFLTYISTVAGVPALLAKASAQLQSTTIANLSPSEQQAYDAIMSAYGAVIGLRSLSRSSAAKFSISKLENEVPIPGLGTASSSQFYDQLGRLAIQISNGTKGLSVEVMPANEKKYYSDQVDKLFQKAGTGGKAGAKPKSLTALGAGEGDTTAAATPGKKLSGKELNEALDRAMKKAGAR